MRSRRIAVVGTGANGAGIAADLVGAGFDVTLVEQWPEHVDAMRKHGLRVEMPAETVTRRVRVLHLCELAAHNPRFDIALILVKAYDTAWAAHLIAPYVVPDGLVVGVQNGMTVEQVAAAAGPERTLGAVIDVSASMLTPGVVVRDSPPDRSWFAVGSVFDETHGREEEVAELLRHSGVVEVVDDIVSAKWMKLVLNAGELAPTALLDEPIMVAAHEPGIRDVWIRASREALEVGLARGIPISPILGIDDPSMLTVDRYPEHLLDVLLEGFVLPTTRTTIWQDWKRGRRSEAGDINGLVSRWGREAGIATPVNDAVAELAARVEKREIAPGRMNLDLLVDALRE
jgi:2-dehydropantoate 2-reductase